MIARYTLPDMGRIWTLKNRYATWLKVEIAACEAWDEIGGIPRGALDTIKKKARFDTERIDEIEKEVKHDVIAFLTSVSEYVGPDSRYIHRGLTSSDIIDTSLSLLMRQAAGILIKDLRELLAVLKKQAFEYKDAPCMGRSHGIHAEPMTFGLKFALWYSEMMRNLERIQRARKVISAGKLSGAVGTFSNIPPEIEEKVCRKLGLKPEAVANQVVQRDRHAEYLIALAVTAATVEKIALEIRHLQRTEVFEVQEPFEKGQKGSSAMPHKMNPVGCENLSGLARVVRANAMASLEDIALWHERDISHSSVERIIIPDSSILLDYMLNRLRGIVSGLQVYPEKMKENIGKSFRLYNSQRVMLALTEKGLSREDAYAIVQRVAMRSWKGKKDFKTVLMKDREIRKSISPEEIDGIFDYAYYFKHIDYLFQRVFGTKLHNGSA
jgi:adenylosuccinate lyase